MTTEDNINGCSRKVVPRKGYNTSRRDESSGHLILGTFVGSLLLTDLPDIFMGSREWDNLIETS